MAEAVLSLTLETLRDLLVEEARFLYGVGDQVKDIQKQLKMMKSFLRDADKKQHEDELVRTWVQEVKSLAYRIEDVLESYAVEIISKKERDGIKNVIKRFACILCECKSVHEIGVEITNINSTIAQLNKARETYSIRDLHAQGESSKEAREKQRLLRQTYAHEVAEHFVGMENDIRQLVSLIGDDERDHRVVSIWGMGGLGKTTLARKIFNHRVVRRSFKAFAWVCITEQCKVIEVLQDILKQILGGNTQESGVSALVTKLHQVLTEKKCLVVLDDIWKMEDWEILSPSFPVQIGDSKVLTTTRIQEVASKGLLYALKSFTEEEGWELLRKRAITNPKQQDLETQKTFELVGKKIVRKCGYLPLAISVLGGILREKGSPREWESVNDNIESYLRKGETSKSSVPNVLNLSYDELPYYLKPCFLYLGRYKEDEKISDLEKLYRLWIAEGFVLSEHCGESETMVDVAEHYLSQLASRCMVQVKINDQSTIQRFKSCRLHDLMRDVCLANAGDEDLFKSIDLDGSNKNTSTLNDNVRRLSMTIDKGSDKEVLFEHVSNPYLRSFLLCNLDYQNHYKMGVVKKFKLLRVVELGRCEVELPREFNQLIHLRYLGLVYCILKGWLSSISELPYLQTLNLNGTTFQGTHSPINLSKMRRLKHIYVFEVENLQFNNFPDQLETLHGYQVSSVNPTDLSKLVNLRSFTGKVEIDALSELIDQINCWSKIKWVKLLEITGTDDMGEENSDLWKKVFLYEKLNELKIRGRIGKFPSYDSRFCINLTSCYLTNTKFDEDPMQILKKFPNLRDLWLFDDTFMGKEMVCDYTAFPQLRTLEIKGLRNLEIWRVDEGALPNLYHLRVEYCPKLETITDAFNISTIRKFNIWEGNSAKFTLKYKIKIQAKVVKAALQFLEASAKNVN